MVNPKTLGKEANILWMMLTVMCLAIELLVSEEIIEDWGHEEGVDTVMNEADEALARLKWSNEEPAILEGITYELSIPAKTS